MNGMASDGRLLACRTCGGAEPGSSGYCSEECANVPLSISGTAVSIMGEPLLVNGERWVTLAPEGEDPRIWEYSVTTGRLVLVVQ